MSTVIGVFRDVTSAENAVRALRDKGFGDNEISIIAKDDQKGRTGNQDMETGDDFATDSMADGTAWGGALGGVAGLLAGMGALAIPGIGPIVAAGPLAGVLSGAVTGGVAGGLIDLGIPEERGRRYEEDIKQGGVLAVVETSEDKVNDASSILREWCQKRETHGTTSPISWQENKRFEKGIRHGCLFFCQPKLRVGRKDNLNWNEADRGVDSHEGSQRATGKMGQEVCKGFKMPQPHIGGRRQFFRKGPLDVKCFQIWVRL